jgi:acyl-CoA thioesterase
MGAFADDIVVRSCGDGNYAASLGHDWDVLRYPQGGVVAALGLRAAQQELRDGEQQLRTATTVFAGPVEAGELEIRVDVLRHGRSASQLRTEVRSRGAATGATTIAVFGSSRAGPAFVDVAPPAVRPPLDCPSFRDPPPPGVVLPDFGPFWRKVEGRAALGHPPWEQFTPTRSDIAAWFRFDQPPIVDGGTLDPLGVLTLADRMPSSISERTGHSGPRFFAPSADLTVHLCAPLRTEWLLAHDRARWAGDGWASIETTLWDEQRDLVGYATQMVFFTYL